jgi:UDP-N-acetylmuramoyl-tripeptide--D-alanyl-D-alanine ligase
MQMPYTGTMEPARLYELIAPEGIHVSTDTRTLKPGDVYIGIRGEKFDGNTFAVQALGKGARYAIVDRPEYSIDDRCIVVSDTRETLEALARIHREHFSIPVLAIGGSNGKTTTKELIAAVLAKKYRVHMTAGNLNNDIGLPLTLLAMPAETQFAVIEIGANHLEEHTKLLSILSPTHVLVTNNGADHLEGFGSLAGVRSANKELYDWAREHGAQAFVNKEIADLMEDSNGMQRILYPSLPYRNVPGTYAAIAYDGIPLTSSLFGSYNIPNMLAAVAVGTHFGVSMQDIQDAIKGYAPTLKRSEVVEKDGATIILDCYNANPTSMELALRDFFNATASGYRVVVIGDMLEMGDAEAAMHKEILELVHSKATMSDTVLCVGPRFGQFKEEYPFLFFQTAADARNHFKTLPLEGKTVFIKASRGIKLEEVLQ